MKKTYNVNIYREVRLHYPGIVASSHEDAARIAADQCSAADNVEDCYKAKKPLCIWRWTSKAMRNSSETKNIDFQPTTLRSQADQMLEGFGSRTQQRLDCECWCHEQRRGSTQNLSCPRRMVEQRRIPSYRGGTEAAMSNDPLKASALHNCSRLSRRIVEITDEDENLIFEFVPVNTATATHPFVTTTTDRTTTMTTTMTTTTGTSTTIPLNRLTAWEGNVRKTDADKNIDELAASIAAHGLLQPLIVRPEKKGKYPVAAGGRRLAALQLLAKAGKIDADAAIDCHVLLSDADAAEISLVENTLREQMHPADQFDAFNALVDRGASVADIAARFGVTESVVLKRLKLARVSPVIIGAYRAGKLDLEQVMAFAISDDHKAQEKCLKAMRRDCDPSRIREHLTEGEIAASHRLVKYVTLKAYENAGGPLRRDLFASGDDGVFILDPELLNSLAITKLEKAAKKVAAEGWKWTAIRIERQWSEWDKCTRVYPEPVPLAGKAGKKLAALEAEHDQLEAEWEANDDEDAEYPERLSELSGLIEEINDKREHVYAAETLAVAGAVVSVDYNGRCDIDRGYILPDDKPKKAAPVRTVENDDGTTTLVEVAETSTLSKPLVENLTLHKSAALTAELIDRPEIALAYLVYTLAVDVFHLDGEACVGITAKRESFDGIEGSKAFAAIETAHGRWAETISGNPEAFLKWCLNADQSVLLDLLAFCTAISIEAAQGNHDELAAALKLDMANWFTPTAENYFSRISKAGIIDALKAYKGSAAPAWDKAKKSDLAAIAERELSGSGWLPDMLKAAA